MYTSISLVAHTQIMTDYTFSNQHVHLTDVILPMLYPFTFRACLSTNLINSEKSQVFRASGINWNLS